MMPSTRRDDRPDADVIIVGAGITGLVLAGLLQQSNFRIALVEARPETDRDKPDEIDPRALAITPASAQVLKRIGAWPQLAQDRVGHFRHMQVWDENGQGEIQFDAAVLGRQTLGYIIESTRLREALLKALTGCEDIRWYQPGQVQGLDAATQRAVVKLGDGRRISASLVVAADGRNSHIRSLAGLAYSEHDYEQQALACIVRTEQPHADTARQRFLRGGTLAFLPLADPHCCGIVWSTRPEEVQALMQLDEAGFREAVARAFEYRLGSLTGSEKRVCYPLAYGAAEAYIADRLALIGDAAHVVHPLAGQGANLGILDAAALSEVLATAAGRQRDPGERPVLRRYERWRKGDNRLMMHVMTGFKELFTRQDFPLPLLRNLGLDITDRLPPLKHYLMEHAMGIRGDIPRAARIPV